MRLALAQTEVVPGAVDGNVDRARNAVARAADRGVDLVVLPEQFAAGFFAFDRYRGTAEPVGGSIHARLRAAARDNGVAVLAGTVVEDLAASRERGVETPAAEGLANTAVLYDAAGERRLVYRKHHLFGYGSAEADRLTAGDRLPVAEVSGHGVAATTCYDLRFPELYRNLVDRGATLVLVPSAWPYPRVEHWRLLPRARAVENLAYVAAVNGVGAFGDDRDGGGQPPPERGDATLCGRSALYDPWGVPVASAGDRSDLLVAEADPDRVGQIRDEFPALDDRRAVDRSG